MAEVSAVKQQIMRFGTRIAFVHMGTEEQGDALAEQNGLEDAAWFRDPERRLYNAFELQKGGAGQVFSVANWLRAAGALRRGHGLGKPAGDIRQMPGVFLLKDGQVMRAFRHRNISDRPDYVALATPSTDNATW